MLLSCSNISKSFLEVPVLKDISFHIEDHDKAAIVGVNGAGKTTLLRIIMKELSPDQGLVTLAKDKTIGYLAQNQNVDSQNSVYTELLNVMEHLIQTESQLRALEQQMDRCADSELPALMERYSTLTHQFETQNGYAYKSELTGVLKGLGFSEDEFDKPIETLSGGQKTRVALGKLLLTKPDLIILDEPTNHLDMSSIKWLETYLLNYKGAVLIVSHDRYFLDRIAGKIIEIDCTKATVFQGNYTDYAAKKEILRAAAWNAYQNQQREIAHQQEVIDKLRSYNREKSIKRAESREKMLNKMEVLDKPTQERTDMKMKLEPRFLSGTDVLKVDELRKSYDQKLLFEHISFSCKRGEHVALIGDNGTGKTTILKIINQLTDPDCGSITLGSNVTVGYYDQEHHVLHPDKTLFEELSDTYPTLTNTQIRNTLAAFLFTGEEVFKRISDLSGGERGRVSLAKLMLSESNFLILDEPTNHLDIMSKEILEDAMNSYTGTILYVSHDRYFINKTAHRILELNGQGLTEYLGNYDYYMEKKEQNISGPNQDRAAQSPGTQAAVKSSGAAQAIQAALSASADSAGKLDWRQQKELQAKQRKKENDLKKCEDKIADLEARKSSLTEEMNDPQIGSDVARLQELGRHIEEVTKQLDALYEEWEALSE